MIAFRFSSPELGTRPQFVDNDVVKATLKAVNQMQFERKYLSKTDMRARLASLSFTEKVEILEKLRDRSHALAAAGLRNRAADTEENSEGARQVCGCSDWEPCGCGNQPPYHCMWCCRELSAKQVAAARERGFYLKEER